MGCSASAASHPNIYNEANGKQPLSNGNIEKKKLVIKVDNSNHIKGDYSQYQVAKYIREKTLKERQNKLYAAADEMSARIMEEREILSLGTRSRGTSRATSRATSPSNNKRGPHFKEKEDMVVSMTPVVEDALSRGGSHRSKSVTDAGEDIKVESKKTEVVTNKKAKKHKNTKSSKPKTKHKKTKKVKKPKKDKQTLIDEGNSDSDLEDEIAISYSNTADDEDKENVDNNNDIVTPEQVKSPIANDKTEQERTEHDIDKDDSASDKDINQNETTFNKNDDIV